MISSFSSLAPMATEGHSLSLEIRISFATRSSSFCSSPLAFLDDEDDDDVAFDPFPACAMAATRIGARSTSLWISTHASDKVCSTLESPPVFGLFSEFVRYSRKVGKARGLLGVLVAILEAGRMPPAALLVPLAIISAILAPYFIHLACSLLSAIRTFPPKKILQGREY